MRKTAKGSDEVTSTNNKKSNKKKIEIENTEVEDKKTVRKEQSPDSTAEKANAEDNVAVDSTPEPSVDDELALERDRYLRLAAEYKNFRDRNAKEREKIYNDARMDTISKLLPVYDNLERALKMECADEAFYRGVEMTMTGLLEIFDSMNIKPIPAVGEPFDPNHHNAVMTVENPELESNTVAEELQKGFAIDDKVIRFSTVIVAN